jgi:hypothetical protein
MGALLGVPIRAAAESGFDAADRERRRTVLYTPSGSNQAKSFLDSNPG